MNTYDVLRTDLRTLIKDWRDQARVIAKYGSTYTAEVEVLYMCADDLEEILDDHD